MIGLQEVEAKIMIMVIDTSMREHAISTHNKTDLEVKENYMYPIS